MDDVTDTEYKSSNDVDKTKDLTYNRETCSECNKPLGNTVNRCYECGGENYRGGSRIGPDLWQAQLGVLHIRMKREVGNE